MEPLDLTQRPPRAPREKALGLVFLPRTIDKVRATLPGGNLGPYLVEGRQSLSSYLLYKLGVPIPEFRDAVARAKDESELLAWLETRIDKAAIRGINEKIEAMRYSTLAPEGKAAFEANHPGFIPDAATDALLDALAHDDRAAFAAS